MRCVLVILFSSISIANVLSLQNLTFFGEYVVFKPATEYIKFDLYEELDMLLLEHRTTRVNSRLLDINYAYRVHLILDDGMDTDKTLKVNCTIYRKGKNMFSGYYKFWNETEKNNMGIRWSSERNNVEVLTELNGNHTTIFSWRDRSENHTLVRYVGMAVEPISIEKNVTPHRHLNWKIREADTKGIEFRNTHRICVIKFLPEPLQVNPAYTYQIQITKEEDDPHIISLEKNFKEILRKKTTRKIDCDDISVSWDAEMGLILFGLRNDKAPTFVCKDDDASEVDLNAIKYVYIHDYNKNRTRVEQYTNETLKAIAEFFPKYKYFETSPSVLMTTPAQVSSIGTETSSVITPDIFNDFVYDPEDSIGSAV